jgi:hypothetical protein
MRRLATTVVSALGALAISAGAAGASTPTSGEEAAFPTLRGTPSDVVPKAVQKFAVSRLGRQFGVDASDVYRSPAPGGGFWSLLPGTGGVCAVFETDEDIAACADAATAARQGFSLRLIRPHPGLMPDGSTPSPTEGVTSQVGIAPAAASGVEQSSANGRQAIATDDNGFYASTLPDSSTKVVLRGISAKRVAAARRLGTIKAHAAWNYSYNFCRASWCFISGSYGSPVLPIGEEQLETTDNSICGNLINSDGSWAGSVFCATSTWTVYSHPYNQSNRTGWMGPGVAGVTSLGAGWVYYN